MLLRKLPVTRKQAVDNASIITATASIFIELGEPVSNISSEKYMKRFDSYLYVFVLICNNITNITTQDSWEKTPPTILLFKFENHHPSLKTHTKNSTTGQHQNAYKQPHH